VPWGRDQLEVAQRVVQSQAGAMLSRGKLNGARLKLAVEKARGCVDGAKRVQAGFQAAGGAERAASLLEAMLPSNGGRRRAAG
jgi:UDP:flavonoid glycosyltransferase YjiC (YdhE family)